MLARILFLTALLISLISCTPGSSVAPGDKAPDFEIPTLSGTKTKLSDFKGKVLLLNFWASWCMPCLSELPSLERLHQRLAPRGFSVVAIGIDDELSKLREFSERYGLSFPVLYDLNGDVKRAYKLSGVPESFIIDRDGKLVMFMDPIDNMPNVRMTGPREWDTPNVIARLEKVLDR